MAEVELRTVGKTLGEVEAEALVDTFSATLSVVVAKTIGDTLTYVEPKAPVETLADTLADVKA